jgi:hypothetical protein
MIVAVCYAMLCYTILCSYSIYSGCEGLCKVQRNAMLSAANDVDLENKKGFEGKLFCHRLSPPSADG